MFSGILGYCAAASLATWPWLELSAAFRLDPLESLPLISMLMEGFRMAFFPLLSSISIVTRRDLTASRRIMHGTLMRGSMSLLSCSGAIKR